jgi:hypothetical protein
VARPSTSVAHAASQVKCPSTLIEPAGYGCQRFALDVCGYLIETAPSVASAKHHATARYQPPAGFTARNTIRPADLSDIS